VITGSGGKIGHNNVRYLPRRGVANFRPQATASANGELYSVLNHTVKTGMTTSIETKRASFETVVKEVVAQQDAGLLDIVITTNMPRLGVSLS
jgi:hypothetical protein